MATVALTMNGSPVRLDFAHMPAYSKTSVSILSAISPDLFKTTPKLTAIRRQLTHMKDTIKQIENTKEIGTLTKLVAFLGTVLSVVAITGTIFLGKDDPGKGQQLLILFMITVYSCFSGWNCTNSVKKNDQIKLRDPLYTPPEKTSCAEDPVLRGIGWTILGGGLYFPLIETCTREKRLNTSLAAQKAWVEAQLNTQKEALSNELTEASPFYKEKVAEVTTAIDKVIELLNQAEKLPYKTGDDQQTFRRLLREYTNALHELKLFSTFFEKLRTDRLVEVERADGSWVPLNQA
ncbi:MAG: hypothetical protein JSS32_03545 [Verrucomicrobia bacterium]|nr:hypothetical protein [Verrucomicrobiota bacterium]